uniref:Uncharacterized protein n=1 Tax=Arundo donax TaxID=35708 RepID=A0A0A8Y556_ARUDO
MQPNSIGTNYKLSLLAYGTNPILLLNTEYAYERGNDSMLCLE